MASRYRGAGTASPPARVDKARQIASSTSLVTTCTEPSIIATFTTSPEWLLRAVTAE
jgi:hypothetical protein